MNSKLLTAILILVALPLGYLASVQLREQDLTSIFGATAKGEGERLYDFNPQLVTRLKITSNSGETATFEKKSGIWIMHSPQEDRANFSTLQTLAFAAASMRVESSLKANEVPANELGLTTGSYTIEAIGSDNTPLAKYRVGRRSVWHHLDAEKEQIYESLFIQPLDLSSDHIYICSGINVRTILNEGFVSLRDRHPFLFRNTHLSDIEIKREGAFVHLSRTSLDAPWRIIKPLELRTNPKIVESLIEQLVELQAIKVTNPESVTETPGESSEAWLNLTIREFDNEGKRSEKSASLTVDAPASIEATTSLGTVSNRSGLAVFELPLQTSKDGPGLNSLPLAVNQLRTKTLLNRDFRYCKEFRLEAEDLPAPLLFKISKDPRTGAPRWLFTSDGNYQPANEDMMKKLRTSLEFDEVAGFASDAASDIGKFGLSEPTKQLLLTFGEEDTIDLRFGRTSDNKFFAMRTGSNSVVEIDTGTYIGIATNLHEWRDSLLWNLNIIDLAGMTIRRANRPPLTITYDDLVEEWNVRRNGQDLTALLNTGKARKFIDFLVALRVERWLGPNHKSAMTALQTPDYQIDIRSRLVDDFGDQAGSQTRTLSISRVSNSVSNKYYFGHLTGDPHYFLLDRFAAEWFTTSLLEDDDSPAPAGTK